MHQFCVKKVFCVKIVKIVDLDVWYMSHAIRLAQKSFALGEVPVGAIAVDEDGTIIARGYNQVEVKKSQLVHAEMQVLKKVIAKKNKWRLSKITVYVTLQPCMMCLGALILSRVDKIVYGAHSPLFGVALDKVEWFGIYKDSLPEVQFLEDIRSAKLLKNFFAQKRRMKDGNTDSFREN